MKRFDPLSSMPHTFILSLIVLTGATACRGKSTDLGDESTTASVIISDLETQADDVAWKTLELKVQRIAPTPLTLEKKFDKAAFAAGSASDLSLKVEYGDYKMALSYKDQNGKIVYTECAEETTKVHQIKEARYNTVINICAKNSDESVGTVDLKAGSEVTIRPQLVSSGR